MAVRFKIDTTFDSAAFVAIHDGEDMLFVGNPSQYASMQLWLREHLANTAGGALSARPPSTS